MATSKLYWTYTAIFWPPHRIGLWPESTNWANGSANNAGSRCEGQMRLASRNPIEVLATCQQRILHTASTTTSCKRRKNVAAVRTSLWPLTTKKNSKRNKNQNEMNRSNIFLVLSPEDYSLNNKTYPVRLADTSVDPWYLSNKFCGINFNACTEDETQSTNCCQPAP